MPNCHLQGLPGNLASPKKLLPEVEAETNFSSLLAYSLASVITLYNTEEK